MVPWQIRQGSPSKPSHQQRSHQPVQSQRGHHLLPCTLLRKQTPKQFILHFAQHWPHHELQTYGNGQTDSVHLHYIQYHANVSEVPQDYSNDHGTNGSRKAVVCPTNSGSSGNLHPADTLRHNVLRLESTSKEHHASWCHFKASCSGISRMSCMPCTCVFISESRLPYMQ